MKKSSGLFPNAEQFTGKILTRFSKWLAVMGGMVLVAIALMTVLSILGRALISIGLKPIPGDFELVEAGCAVAVFSFLPWCQLSRGHVTVDILADRFSLPIQALLKLLGNVALSALSIVIGVQMWPGLVEKYTYGETTFILGMPVWYGYAIGFVGAVLFALTCIYSVWRSLNEKMRGQSQTNNHANQIGAG